MTAPTLDDYDDCLDIRDKQDIAQQYLDRMLIEQFNVSWVIANTWRMPRYNPSKCATIIDGLIVGDPSLWEKLCDRFEITTRSLPTFTIGDAR